MIHIVKPGETIVMIAANYRVPLSDLYKYNPGLTQLYPGQKIIIPGLEEPSAIPYVIRVSLRKRTLALFQNGSFLKIYPVGIGKMLTQTPFGEYVIVNREPLPGGPFGVMWLSLSRAGYGIHGTNNPSSIGKAVSHGCIRMYNRDVIQLANIVPNGTKVIIEQ
ncbi:MAG: L,D-transpeptidase family protein [Bacillota bacterium]|nr:L,D-transpeptidase family protein [Bacillota bacterium]